MNRTHTRKFNLSNPILLEIKVKKAVASTLCTVFFIILFFRTQAQNAPISDSILLNEAYELLDNREYSKALNSVIFLSEKVIKKRDLDILIGCQEILFLLGLYGNKPKDAASQLEINHFVFDKNTKNYKELSAFFVAATLRESGNIIRSLNWFEGIIELIKEKNNESLLNGVYNDLGIIYIRLGDYVRAKKFINASKEINIRTSNNRGYGNNIYNLASVNFHMRNFQESEKLFKEYLDLYPEEQQDIYMQISDLKVYINELDSARFYFTKAQKAASDFSEYELDERYADILNAEGDVKTAIELLAKHTPVVDSIENNRIRGKYYYKLADLYLKNENLNEALSYFDQSLMAFTNQQINTQTIDSLTEKTYLLNEIWIGDILISLAKIYDKKYSNDRRESTREETKKCISLALDALDYKRSFFEDMESSIFANKKSKELYEIAINIYLNWYASEDEDKYLDMAFQVAQRHNAFLLRQQVNERVLLSRFQVEESLQKAYIDQKLKVLEKSYMVGQNYSRVAFEKLKEEEAILDSFSNILNEKYPKLKDSKNDFEVSSIEQIQETLTKDKAIIKYFEGEHKIYSFVITYNDVSCYLNDKREEINTQITQLRSLLSDFKHDLSLTDSLESMFLSTSFQLSTNIISEALEGLPDRVDKLVIIPTGSLTQIPFESLVVKEVETWKDPSAYLIQEYAVSYNYFCKELISPESKKSLEDVISYGLEYDEYTLNASKKMSNDSISNQILDKFRSEEMGHLFFADDEAKEVSALFDGVSFTNENATKKNFLSNVLDYDIIHLSAHSFVDFQFPSNSSIIFSKKDSLTDNMLRIKDVDRLTLDGQLFTLSACNTFYGKKNEGEGLSSMARSFIQSGAGSVIGSFWSVPDEISKSFMVHFYSKLKEGLPKDEALQATKLDFMTDDNLSSPIYRTPAYWSAWVIYGDTQSIKKSNNWILYSGLGILLLGILYFLRMRYLNMVSRFDV